MAFWRTETLKLRMREVVPTGKENRIKHGAYELSMGEEAFITGNTTKQYIRENEQIAIPSGQMALLLTEEFTMLPTNAIGFISIKSKYKFRGLVNISGFHVDPGFAGKLIFSVYNAGPEAVVLTRGAPVFLLWCCELDEHTTDHYDGEHRVQQSISDDMVQLLQGQISSPASLQAQIDELKATLARWQTSGALVLAAASIVGLLLKFWPAIKD